jgi:vancomycin resistance protein YoaR
MGWNGIFALMIALQHWVFPNSHAIIMSQGEVIADHVEREAYWYPAPGIPLINEEKLNELTGRIAGGVERPAVNASLDAAGRIVPERNGAKLDPIAFKRLFYGFMLEGEPTQIEAPLRPVYPRVDSEILSAIKVKQIGQYATYFNSRNQNRSANIALAAKALNNHVVFPGERFSFNQTVGKRTSQKGYMRAPVIVRGELYEDIGGGICQVSSTLFNAADRSGMKIVERYSHSRSVRYVPPGRDATVSWYGPDFVFENPYDQPVLIRAFVSPGAVQIIICSSELVELRPRQVPEASKELPEEVRMDEKKASVD